MKERKMKEKYENNFSRVLSLKIISFHSISATNNLLKKQQRSINQSINLNH